MAKTGAVTLIQRFGSALNLNVHFHMLFLDGVYVRAIPRLSAFPLGQGADQPRAHPADAPSPAGWVAIWNSKACWNGMSKTAIWPRMRWMTTR